MTKIYILKLESDKYYIGQSDNILRRIDQHTTGNGSYWTKLYKPIDILDIISDCDRFDEDKYTLQYMDKYGVENVRGGTFCQKTLSKDSLQTIERMLNSIRDVCQNCGKSGHYINKCPIKNQPTKNQPTKKSDVCFRCGRAGHRHANCYAKKDFDNKIIEDVYTCDTCDEEFDTESAAIAHEKTCSNLACARCGRVGHVQLDCYATKHTYGYYLKKL